MPPKKATPQQHVQLLELVEHSDILRWGKGTPEMKREAWEHLSQAVNSIGGTTKSAEAWKKAFIEWKSHIKGKIRNEKPLTEIESKCASITGLFVSCSGVNIPELGFEKQVELYEVREGILENISETLEGPSCSHEEPSSSHEGPSCSHEGPSSSVVNITDEDHSKNKKNISSKKVKTGIFKSTKLLLDEHVNVTNNGLQDIAKSILAVADSINNLAAAIRENK